MISPLKRISKNFFSLLTAQILSKIINLAFVIYLTRHFGSEIYGQYITIVALLFIFSNLADFGLNQVLVRDIAKRRSLMQGFVSTAVVLKTLLSLFAFIFLVILSMVLEYSDETVFLTFLAGLSILPNSIGGVLLAPYTALEKMHIPSSFSIIMQTLATVTNIIILAAGFGLREMFISSFILSILSLGVSYSLARNIGFKMSIDIDFNFSFKLLKASLPFAVLVLVGVLSYKIDIILLSKLAGTDAVGWFGAAFRTLEVFLFVPASLMGALFPLMSSYHVNSMEKLISTYLKSLRIMIVLAFPIAVIITLFSEKIILLLYGEDFLPSAVALSILVWALGIAFINSPVGNVVLTSEKFSKCLPLIIISNAIKIGLSFLLVYRFGYVGACFAFLISEIIGFFTNIYFLKFILGYVPNFLQFCARPFFAVILMGFILFLFHSMNLFFLFTLGCVLYLIGLLLLGEFKLKDIALVYQRLMF